MRLLKHGSKIGKATVIVDIIPKGNHEIRPGAIISPKFITYHNTGNIGRGANAKAHNIYIHNMASLTPKDTSHISWHLSVDENYIYQHIPFDENAWHCGDGNGRNSGNMTSIGIEICEHIDQKNYHQAEENAIELGNYLASVLKIPIKNHVPHQKWSGKYCPRVILNRDGDFSKFHKRIEGAINKAVVSQVETSVANVMLNDEKSIPAIIKDGRTYVQVREIAELLGLKITYNNESKTTILHK